MKIVISRAWGGSPALSASAAFWHEQLLAAVRVARTFEMLVEMEG